MYRQRLRYAGTAAASPDGSAALLVTAIEELRDGGSPWTNRFSPRFHDPAVVAANAEKIRGLLADHSVIARLRRWIARTPLDYDPGSVAGEIMSNSGRLKLDDFQDIEAWAKQAVDCAAASPTGRLRISLLRLSYNDDTSLTLELASGTSGETTIELQVASFLAEDDLPYREQLIDRIAQVVRQTNFTAVEADSA